ncbi:YpdA family putative bacillithiol disulfide reductase [Pontibacillus salipaludis]|uniref:YpdA family putative bacillithiol disulfide reductase n=1 Tax=Pontibacillus salipaludis TaxID=1697394 RepID=UPI0031EBD8D6
MQKEDVIVVGAGPCGLSAAIELQERGLNPLIIEKGNVVNAIYNYPTHQTFFSSSEKLEIGRMPFITEMKKPVRNQALAYYRAVAKRKNLRVNAYEKVTSVTKDHEIFTLCSERNNGKEVTYQANQIIIATGYYDHPNHMGVPGETLDKVSHYFKESHPYFDKDVVVIGGKNSAVDATLELVKAGANVTVLYRQSDYSKSVKPWILPEFEALVNKEVIKMEFNATVTEITNDKVYYEVHGEKREVENDFVFAMTGYHPDHSFLRKMGIEIEEDTGRPTFNKDTMETNIEGIYIAGVIAAGYNNNEIFIENGRHHGEFIAEAICSEK